MSDLPTNCVHVKALKKYYSDGFYTIRNEAKDKDLRAFCVFSKQPYLIYYHQKRVKVKKPEDVLSICQKFNLKPMTIENA